MRPPLAAEAKLGLINKTEKIIDEIAKKEKKFFLLNHFKLINSNTHFVMN